MREMLETKLGRFEELEQQMSDPEVLADSKRTAAVAREHGSLIRLASKYRHFKRLIDEISQLQKMTTAPDAEEREMAEAELPGIREQREKAWLELLDMTVGGEEANRARCIMEIRAGTGGDEAALFAHDLFEMYTAYAEQKRWKCEIMEAYTTELGGFSQVNLAFEGEGCFRELQYESGGHRVQRVPQTETKGRVHTSAATVVVMPEPEDVEVNLKSDDYRLDKYCASGPGGQHVNKTESAVRLTHYDTNIVVAIQDEKSQHKNLAKALRILKSRVYEHYRLIEHEKRSETRRSLAGSGDRSERIRTYNFPDNRVTDHRIGLSLYKLDQIIAGDVGPVISALIEHDRNELRDAMGGLD